jgi:hypothetical protein
MIALRSLIERISTYSNDKRRAGKPKQARHADAGPVHPDKRTIAPHRRHRVLRGFDAELVRDCD